MQTYLVGGAVRDQLLGRHVSERDWVVIGATDDDMRRLGYRQVGYDFPVYLHPDTGEEYALARTERKQGRGHKGFDWHVGSEVTLEDDLRRRDLTINAMARNADNGLVDPYGGCSDLADKVLRHVSDAFSEDPLRVFRVARFTATFPDFKVEEETAELMRMMVKELADLPAERIWMEWTKAADQDAPWRFFETLHEIGARQPWFDDIDLEALAALYRSKDLRGSFSLAVIGWNHSEAVTSRFAVRLKVPRRVSRAATLLARWGRRLVEPSALGVEGLMEHLQGIGAFRNGADVDDIFGLIESCEKIELSKLRSFAKELAELKVNAVEGRAYGKALRMARMEMIEKMHPVQLANLVSRPDAM
ncbi:MAG: multifunctional CCA tRNA nucleotidyl transferase/2'3'-cyclic phosphodiesterase/2'nucleotidase/phosphatase [Pseudomonadota bacterium]|nr:multifunctional CCA tRNA nucleotidyl transferase/2'3'-cyclic phosphodiesterase/2'nucleotidase/phosphatase [Pseudomonadota bacterium]